MCSRQVFIILLILAPIGLINQYNKIKTTNLDEAKCSIQCWWRHDSWGLFAVRDDEGLATTVSNESETILKKTKQAIIERASSDERDKTISNEFDESLMLTLLVQIDNSLCDRVEMIAKRQKQPTWSKHLLDIFDLVKVF